MHVLVIPSWYTTRINQVRGSFFREQARSLSERVDRLGVVYPYLLQGRTALRERRILPARVGLLSEERFVNEVWEIPFVTRAGVLSRLAEMSCWRWLVGRYIRRHGRPDVLLLHSALKGEVALWAKSSLGLPFVVVEHSSAFARGLLGSEELERCRAVFEGAGDRRAVSRSLQGQLSALYGLEFGILPNFLADGEFRGAPRSEPRAGDRYTVLSIGALTGNKNHLMLVEAFAIGLGSDPRFELVIAGEGPERERIGAAVSRLGLEDRVRMPGAVSRSQVPGLLARADLFVLPSVYETFGVAAVEALAAGVPVVATRSGGPEDIVSPDVGTLCECTTQSLSQALREAVARRFDAAVVVERARSRFSSSAVLPQLLDCLESAVRGQPQRSRPR